MPKAAGAPQRGFTILEVVIALAVGLFMAVGVTRYVRSTFTSEARRFMPKLQGTIKFFYNQAALEGKTYRLKVSLASQRIEAEVGEGITTRPRESASAPAAESGKPASSTAKDKVTAGTTQASGETKATSETTPPPSSTKSPAFAAATGTSGPYKPIVFPGKVILREVRVPLRPEPVTEGEAYIYAFPSGYVDPAVLVFSNATEDRHIVLTINALTGSSRLTYRRPEESD